MRLLLLIVPVFFLLSCARQSTHLERIVHSGQIVVIIRSDTTTDYQDPLGMTGLEFELAQEFAKFLNVELKIIVENNLALLFKQLADGKADLAAAGLSMTQNRQHFLHFGPSYLESQAQLVYRIGHQPHPHSLQQLHGRPLEVAADSSHAEFLARLNNDPQLHWYARKAYSTKELIHRVWAKQIDYTIANATEIQLNQRFYPGIAVAFDLPAPINQMAWAVHRRNDRTLVDQTELFFAKLKASGKLEALKNKHYGHTRQLDYVGTKIYLRDIQKKLPQFIDQFKTAALIYDLDWRLLSALGYQESHWEPEATSPTGVRGMMMLTHNTADFVGIHNRLDVQQSIHGGAKYLRYLIDKIPKRITDPDRTWMALAAYNVGYGHLEDARILTQNRGGNPDQWIAVRKTLPLLAQRKWYQHTKHGYARGNEPVVFVDNIRNYYELLVWQSPIDWNGIPSTPP